jgi:hypothetical protein
MHSGLLGEERLKEKVCKDSSASQIELQQLPTLACIALWYRSIKGTRKLLQRKYFIRGDAPQLLGIALHVDAKDLRAVGVVRLQTEFAPAKEARVLSLE